MKTKQRIFHKTIIQVEVLSEDFYDFNDLEGTHYDITEGACSGKVQVISQVELNAKQVREALFEQGSDPSFFQVTC